MLAKGKTTGKPDDKAPWEDAQAENFLDFDYEEKFLGEKEEQQEIERLKANASAAWLVNLVLVVYLVYLYQKQDAEEAPVVKDASSSEAVITLLSQELSDESTALTTDKRLKQDLQEQLRALDDLAQRSQEATVVKSIEAPLLERLQALLSSRDEELERKKEATEQNLREAATIPEEVPKKVPKTLSERILVDSSLLSKFTNSASGLLAAVDVGLAANFISLAFFFTFATDRLSKRGEKGPEEPQEDPALRAQNLVRFYGRWDDDHEWVLVKSVPLQGMGNSVIGSVRSAQGVLGSWSDRIITSLVARSARGLVRRRGWKRIVEQTMDEVGRTFYLGYLVETAADKAVLRIKVDCKERTVLEVPSSIVLEG